MWRPSRGRLTKRARRRKWNRMKRRNSPEKPKRLSQYQDEDFLRSPLLRSVWLMKHCTNRIETGVGRASRVEDERMHTEFENLVQYQ